MMDGVVRADKDHVQERGGMGAKKSSYHLTGAFALTTR